MRHYLRTWVGAGLLLTSTVSLFAQRYADCPLGSEGFPAYPSDYEALVRYSYDYKHSKEDLARMFRLDTVSLAEMRAHYEQYANAAPPANVYAGKDSVGGIWNMLLVRSPLADAPVKEARSGRGVWKFPPLQLKGIQGDKSAGSTFDRLVKKYAVKSRDAKQGNSASSAAYPGWFSGPLVLLANPVYDMGFIVSGAPWFLSYEEGSLQYSTYIQGAPDFYSYLSRRGALDGYWHSGIAAGMYQFSLAASSQLPPAAGQQPVRFTWLLTIDAHGRQDAQLLAPKSPDEATRQAFERLRTFVQKLRSGLFHEFYTSDGRVLPGRYIQALYDERGWQFQDLMTLPED